MLATKLPYSPSHITQNPPKYLLQLYQEDIQILVQLEKTTHKYQTDVDSIY